jgi:hypothetical protein
MILVFNPAAFKHGVDEADIEAAMATALVDELLEGTIPILTDEEADALDELLTKTTPNTNPNVQGPFIRQRDTLVILDAFSAEYLKAIIKSVNSNSASFILYRLTFMAESSFLPHQTVSGYPCRK